MPILEYENDTGEEIFDYSDEIEDNQTDADLDGYYYDLNLPEFRTRKDNEVTTNFKHFGL